MRHWSRFVLAGAVLLAVFGLRTASAQFPAPGAAWTYSLIEGSDLVDDCPICDRVPIVEPIRGTFLLRCLENGPFASLFQIENLWLTNSGNTGRTYQVAGNGTLQISGEFAAKLSLSLDVYINDGITNRLCYFQTNWVGFSRPWPMLAVSVDQTNGTVAQQYHLDLKAAPFQELWFSTAQDFTAGIWQAPTNVAGHGDLLAHTGRTVKRNAELTRNLGIMPPAPDIGLKDLDILPGGEIAFSITQDTWSESLNRELRSGDLLSSRGLLLRTNESLLAAFAPDPPLDAGLAAVKLMSAGDTWFSVQTNFFSTKLGVTIYAGDLLSDSGAVIRRNADLLKAFGPVDPSTNAGLTAVYVWPSGEIWFCTERDFAGANTAVYSAGDVLSDQGYVVYRNAELLSAFAPVKTNAIPVDGLWIVSDTIPNSPPPVLLPLAMDQPPGSILVGWRGFGRVFQVEGSSNVAGPYRPASAITPDSGAVDTASQTNPAARFYRVRQW